MVTFIGEYTARIDDKGRLVFPSPLKAALPPGSDMRFVVKKDLFEHLTFNKTHATFWREYMRDRDIVEPDPRFGRISISRRLLDSIGAGKEVVFSGNDFRIEIWARERFEESRISNEDIVAIAESLSKK